MRWVEHATLMGAKANVYSILVEKLEGKSKHFGVDGHIILNEGWVERFDLVDR
jgi:hypothetical protein